MEKGLTVYWWQVFLRGAQGKVCLVSKNLACQAWELRESTNSLGLAQGGT